MGLRISHVTMLVKRNWLVGFTAARRYATRGPARPAGFGQCIGANVGRGRRRGSVVRGSILGVRSLVRKCLGVGSISVVKGVIQWSVGRARYRARGHVHVGRECMKDCLAKTPCRCVVQLVIRRSVVAIIGARRGVIVGSALRLAEQLSLSGAAAGA